MIEWMTQQHYLGLDPRRRRPRSAVQEPDAASLDGRSAARQARHPDRRGARRRPHRSSRSTRRSTNSSRSAPSSTTGCKTQAGFNLDALEKAIGRKVENRDEILAQQHQAARWTYIGSGMVHERFKATLRDPFAARCRTHRRSGADLRLNQPTIRQRRNDYA